MWIPQTEDEIVHIISSGALRKTATLDAKGEAPNRRPVAFARDVAAMATDGGVLLYGIADDAAGQPTVLAAITCYDLERQSEFCWFWNEITALA